MAKNTIFYLFVLRPLAGLCGGEQDHRFCPEQMKSHTAWLEKQGVVISRNVWEKLEEGEATDPIAYGKGHEVVITREVPDVREVPAVW